ncbi:hypothetical protein KC340_g27 [Hortaea werneckii]|nr:hypothetical protein KC340_g27 [Hortaea werneckii]
MLGVDRSVRSHPPSLYPFQPGASPPHHLQHSRSRLELNLNSDPSAKASCRHEPSFPSSVLIPKAFCTSASTTGNASLTGFELHRPPWKADRARQPPLLS